MPLPSTEIVNNGGRVTHNLKLSVVGLAAAEQVSRSDTKIYDREELLRLADRLGERHYQVAYLKCLILKARATTTGRF